MNEINLTTEKVIVTEKIILDISQKEKLRDTWNNADKNNPPTLKELVTLIFPGRDARDRWGIAVRTALCEMSIKAKPSSIYQPKNTQKAQEKPGVELTEPQKELIKNNVNQMPIDLARTIFNDSMLGTNTEV